MFLTKPRGLAAAALAVVAVVALLAFRGTGAGGDDDPERAGAADGNGAARRAPPAAAQPGAPPAPASEDEERAARARAFREGVAGLGPALQAALERCPGLRATTGEPAAPAERRLVEVELRLDPLERDRRGADAPLRVTATRVLDANARPLSREAAACLARLRGRPTAVPHPAAGDPLSDQQPVQARVTLALPAAR